MGKKLIDHGVDVTVKYLKRRGYTFDIVSLLVISDNMAFLRHNENRFSDA